MTLEQMNGKIPFDAAKAGDEAGMEVIKNMRVTSHAELQMINTFLPEKVILAEELSRAERKSDRTA